MQNAKFPRSTLLSALAISLILVASAYVSGLAVVANARAAAASSVRPIKGVDVIVQKNPGGSASRTKTDADGGFTVAGLEPGQYTISLQCKECERSIEGEPQINITLTGTCEGTFKKTIRKVALLNGLVFQVGISGKQLRGTVTYTMKSGTVKFYN